MDTTNYFWQGDLVRLSGLGEEDVELSFNGRFDTPARRLLQGEVELPMTIEQIRERYEKFSGCREVDGMIIFAIINRAEQHVGGISFYGRNAKDGIFSFGISIAAPYRGKGYAQDAVRLLMKFGFWEQRYQKCNSACLHNNTASIRLHQSLGFVQEGLRRRMCFMDGQYFDEILFGLTREEFDATMGKE